MIGLLNSEGGASLVRESGYRNLHHLGLKLDKTLCTLVNGDTFEVIGLMKTPIELMNKVHIVDVLVIINQLILGTDFWLAMNIVSNMFLDDIHVKRVLIEDASTDHQLRRLNDSVIQYFEKMGTGLGSITITEYDMMLE
ncbi:hypothetical protein HHI36_018164 [Cryptolaemus montrouzieri]|uniref:Uncharacterized protein n=1 Tax=Cryptolaemus montrouzieri TaxID=559131 RepID=A0ABD2NZE5_9CUCU